MIPCLKQLEKASAVRKRLKLSSLPQWQKSLFGQQKRFYELNLELIKTMSLDDVLKHIAISPEEFYGETPVI